MTETEYTMRSKRKNGSLLWLNITLAILIFAAFTFFTWKYLSSRKTGDDAVVAAVGRHIVLPDETPTVSTVERTDELRKQAFFSNAEHGDKVLIFTAARKIMIYRPSSDIIINAGPIIDDGGTVTESKSN